MYILHLNPTAAISLTKIFSIKYINFIPVLYKAEDYSDQELLQLVKSGDNEAFEALYFSYFARLARYAYKRLPDEATVEELVQDVFVDLWKQRESLDENGNVAGLLFAMLRYKALHALRAQMIRARHLDSFTQLQAADEADDLSASLTARQLQAQLEQAVERLSPQCREAFTLSRYEHLAYKDIAERMGVSVNTVEKHIGKALKLLRAEFREYNLPVMLMIGLLELALQR